MGAGNLEKLLEILGDTSDMTDDEVRADLVARGVDLPAAQARFDRFLDDAFAKRAARLAAPGPAICTDESED